MTGFVETQWRKVRQASSSKIANARIEIIEAATDVALGTVSLCGECEQLRQILLQPREVLVRHVVCGRVNNHLRGFQKSIVLKTWRDYG